MQKVHDIKPRVKCSYCPYEDTRRMAVVTHMRLKHPGSRGVALSSSKSYAAEEDTNSSSSNSGPHITSAFGPPNPISGPDTNSTYGVPNPMPSYSATPTYVGPRPKEAPKVHQEDGRSEPSRISELYPDISITVGETPMEPLEESDWSVELKSGRSDVKLPRVVKEIPSVEHESTEVDLKLKLQSYHNISFKLTGRSDENGVEDFEPEVILHENNNERGPADNDEAEDKLKSKKEDRTGKISETSDKIDYDNDPLANCNGDDDCDVKQRLQSYPNISFEVTLTPSKRRERLKRRFEPEVIMTTTESDFVMDQEKEVRRVLTPKRLQTVRVYDT